MAALPTHRGTPSGPRCEAASLTVPIGVSPAPPTLPSPCLRDTPDSPRLRERVHRSAPSHTGQERDITSVPGVGCPWFKLALYADAGQLPSLLGGGRPQHRPALSLKASGTAAVLPGPLQCRCSGVHCFFYRGLLTPLPPTHKDPRMEKGSHGEGRTEVTPGGLAELRRSHSRSPALPDTRGPARPPAPDSDSALCPQWPRCWPVSRLLPALC